MAQYMYVGSFSPGGGGGYSLFRWNPETAAAEFIEEFFPDFSAGMTCFDPEKNLVYFTDEKKKHPAFRFGGGGRLMAAKADPASGRLTRLNEVPSYGANPSYVASDREGKYAVVTNFGPFVHAEPVTRVAQKEDGSYEIQIVADDASVVLYRLKEDGSIDGICDFFRMEPEGTPEAPDYPHGHCVQFSPDNRFLAVTDLGTGKIFLFRINQENARLELVSGKPYQYEKGFGPRYAAFHPQKPWLFVNFEDSPCVTSFRYGEDGLSEIAPAVRIVPGDSPLAPDDMQSGLALSPDGRFLYTVIRGRNQVMALRVDPETGALTQFQTYQLSGDRPKDLAISPDGKTLAVASRGNDCVELLSIGGDGTLTDTGNRAGRRAAGHVFFLSFSEGGE